MPKYDRINKDYVEAFCEAKGFSYVEDGFEEGEAVAWVINDEGIYEYYSLGYIRRSMAVGSWATPEGMVAGAYEVESREPLEDVLSQWRWR